MTADSPAMKYVLLSSISLDSVGAAEAVERPAVDAALFCD
jgi:hypothetical protein